MVTTLADPLALGATPQQVFIDGIPQITRPVRGHKPSELQNLPKTPSWDKEAKDAVKFRGLPPLKGEPSRSVAFLNVGSVWERESSGLLSEAVALKGDSVMLFVDGDLACSSFRGESGCGKGLSEDVIVVDLEGGSMAPGLTSFGGGLGLSEIQMESSTNDGAAYGPFDREFTVLGNLDRAADGLSFEGRNML